jgi:hypothetical protein
MTTARYWTAQQILDRAAIERGLDAPGTGVYSITDKNVILLRELLNTVGQELVLMHEWPALVKEHTITVANPGDTGEYTLPADFNGMLSDSGWNRTTDYRMVPVSPQVWQWIKTGAVTSSLPVYFRLQADKLKVETVPANGTVLAFEYHSRYWARSDGQTSPDKASCTVASDVVHLEPTMAVALLLLRFAEVRGLDTSAPLLQFERRFEAAAGRVQAARTLTLGGRRGYAVLGAVNLRDTGFGL